MFWNNFWTTFSGSLEMEARDWAVLFLLIVFHYLGIAFIWKKLLDHVKTLPQNIVIQVVCW